MKATIDQVVLQIIANTLSALVQNNATRMLSMYFGIEYDGPYLSIIDELSLYFCSLYMCALTVMTLTL